MGEAGQREWLQPLVPPHFVTAGAREGGVSLDVTADASTTVVEMRLQGRWSQQLGSQVAAVLQRCLAGPCEAVILDLHGVTDPNGRSQPYWSAVLRTAGLGPTPVHLAFCSPPETMLDHRLRQLEGAGASVCETLSQARIAIAGKVSRTDRLQARLTSRPAWGAIPAYGGKVVWATLHPDQAR